MELLNIGGWGKGEGEKDRSSGYLINSGDNGRFPG